MLLFVSVSHRYMFVWSYVFLDLLGNRHWMLFYLAASMRPRMLTTLDVDTQKPIAVSVRVGMCVVWLCCLVVVYCRAYDYNQIDGSGRTPVLAFLIGSHS